MTTNGASPGDAAARTLMLGYGWFPDRLGGLNRYYRDLLEHLPDANGIVVGGDASTPARVAGVSGHERPLPERILSVWRASQRAAATTDVVEPHFALYSLAPLWVGKLRSTPVVVQFQGPWADECVAAGDPSVLRRTARRTLERAVYRRADQAIVLTSAFRQVLVERYGVKPWIVNVEPPGVDLKRFSLRSPELARAEFGLPADAFIAVAVRRLVARMGLEVLLEAWRGAVQRLPGGSVLLLAGDGPLRDELQRAAATYDVADSVKLLGRVSDEKLATLYQAASVAVVPTLQHEGFGLVVIEAAACGTPSIVSDVGGLPEAIAGLDPSLIVAPGDPIALRDRLVASRNDLPSRADTRAYAEHFDWKRVAERHTAIVTRALRAPGHTHAGNNGSGADGRVKVVYLDHVAQLSGGELALLRLLPHLDHVNPHVILAEDGPLVSRLHLAGVSTEVLPFAEPARDLRKRDVHGGGISPLVAAATVAYVAKLAVRLRRLNPDLVHTNSLKAGLYGSLAARLAGIPVVWHVRDRIAEDYLPRPAVTLVRQMTRRLATAVVANSRSTLETLAARSHPVVIYSVLPEVLSDVRVGDRTRGGPLTFGVVGRLAPWKGQDFFLRAFAHAFPDGHERAVVVGGALFGEDDYAARLPTLAQDLGIADRVDLRGHRTDIWRELAQLDVLVHSSITPEPFGQVVLEGMAAGIPVIAAGAGGPAEILQHDVTGLLYEPSDVDDLASAMRRLRDPDLRERLSFAARNGLGPYTPQAVASQLQDLYFEIVERHQPRRHAGSPGCSPG
ncbi:MAG: glycosyltransferase family 4 protein [Solirubrobacteraceae bacterium]